MSELYDKTYNPDVLSCLANLSNDEVFTPPEVANQMLGMLPREIWSDPNATFLDPACKSGVFLREIAKRLIKGLEDEFPDLDERLEHIFKKQLHGVAITELTSLLSRRSVYCSKYPNSKYSVIEFDNAEGSIRFKRCEHSWVNGKCKYCGAAQGEYDRSDELESYAYEFIHFDNSKELFPMKFDVIISNPPYQLSDGGAQASAKPIYQHFVNQAEKLNPHYLSMIMPARWYSGGKGLDDFRAKMLADRHIKELHDFPNTDDCFPGVNIRGGVCYFLWDRNYDNSVAGVRVVTHEGENYTEVQRPLKYKDLDIFVRQQKALSILEKVSRIAGSKVLSSIVSSRKPFGIGTSFINDPDFHSAKEGLQDPVVCIARGLKKGYIEKSQVKIHQEWLGSWKVLTSRANNIGTELPDDNLNTYVVGPGTCCTESYIVIGGDSGYNEGECRNLSLYLRTKFARFMHGVAKASQDATSKTYRFVPLLDYSKKWTDQELYSVFGLNQDEITFIEESIQPMDTGE